MWKAIKEWYQGKYRSFKAKSIELIVAVLLGPFTTAWSATKEIAALVVPCYLPFTLVVGGLLGIILGGYNWLVGQSAAYAVAGAIAIVLGWVAYLVLRKERFTATVKVL